MDSRVKKYDKVLLFFFVAAIISSSLIWMFEEKFEPEAWRDQAGGRHKMVDDLLDSRLLIGKTEAEVLIILGEPDRSDLTGKHHLIYNLGKGPSFYESKQESLIVIFENGIAAKTLHVER